MLTSDKLYNAYIFYRFMIGLKIILNLKTLNRDELQCHKKEIKMTWCFNVHQAPKDKEFEENISSDLYLRDESMLCLWLIASFMWLTSL